MNYDIRRSFIASGLAILLVVIGVWCVDWKCASVFHGQDVEYAFPDERNVRFTTLEGNPQRLGKRRVLGAAGSFGWISDLEIVGERIVVLDRFGDRKVWVVEKNTGDVIDATGRPGRGPGEFLTPYAINSSLANERHVWVYDIENGRLTLLDLTALSKGPLRSIQIQGGLFKIASFGDTLVANGFFAPEVLRFFVLKANVARVAMTAGRMPVRNARPMVAAHLNRSSLAVDWSRKRIAVAFLYLNRLHFYDSLGRLNVAVDGPEHIDPVYRIRQRSDDRVGYFARSRDTRWGYLDSTASDQHVFALFSGRSPGEYKDNAYAGDQLHVFSWDGDLIGVWVLDEDVYRIEIDDDGRTLFGVRANPFPSIVEFEPLRTLNSK